MRVNLQHAIMMFLDENTTKLIESHINRFFESNGFEKKALEPHITIGSWFGECTETHLNYIREFTLELKSFDVLISSFGFFRSENTYFFLSPVKSEKLCNIHKKLHKNFPLGKDESFDTLYSDINLWVPHLAIGYKLTDEELSLYVDYSKNIQLPIKGRAVKIGIAECSPFSELCVFDIKV